MWPLRVCDPLRRSAVFTILSRALMDAGQDSGVRKVVKGSRKGREVQAVKTQVLPYS